MSSEQKVKFGFHRVKRSLLLLCFTLNGKAMESRRDAEIFHPLLHFLGGQNSQFWIRPEPGGKNSKLVSHKKSSAALLSAPYVGCWVESRAARI